VTRVSEARAVEIYEAARNWGRWGADDERGALNLLTPERVLRASSLVRAGTVVSCGRELAVKFAIDNPSPALHHMVRAGDVAADEPLQSSGDFIGVSFHGMAVSHIDALCHVFVDGQMYNGFPASDVTSLGAKRGAIDAAFGGIVGRGVLLDIPRLRGVEWLEPGEVVMPDDLDRACATQNVEVESGDLLLISTGRDARRGVRGAWNPMKGLAGLDGECVPWLHAHDPALLGSDGVSDLLPPNPHAWPMPVHQCLLTGMGVHLLDNLHLGRLAEACANEERWEFMFVVLPLHIGGGTGSPVNPVAVF
jgi:kynurenine formamidase